MDRALSLIPVFVILAGMVPSVSCVLMVGVLLQNCAQLVWDWFLSFVVFFNRLASVVYFHFNFFLQPPVRQAASTEAAIILTSATAILVTVAQLALLIPSQAESIHAALPTSPRLAIWQMAS